MGYQATPTAIPAMLSIQDRAAGALRATPPFNRCTESSPAFKSNCSHRRLTASLTRRECPGQDQGHGEAHPQQIWLPAGLARRCGENCAHPGGDAVRRLGGGRLIVFIGFSPLGRPWVRGRRDGTKLNRWGIYSTGSGRFRLSSCYVWQRTGSRSTTSRRVQIDSRKRGLGNLDPTRAALTGPRGVATVYNGSGVSDL
jgi:hypothetical protein